MFSKQTNYSLVTGVLPNRTTNNVLDEIIKTKGAHAFLWKCRGTLIYDSWRKALMPSVSPAKSIFQMVLPEAAVGSIVDTVIEVGRLHQQATGAVFSSRCENAFLGSEFQVWPGEEHDFQANQSPKGDLSVIYCVVSRKLSDRVSKAAIRSGAHGPIIYYAEGRGLRDRLGWLRITKETEKEVLMMICDESDVGEIFDAIAQAGELHLPGRGFMYRLNVQTGMFNLPSLVSNHHYKASMQQIINTIDHLAGHKHWRDQSSFDVGSGRATGRQFASVSRQELKDQVAISAIVKRAQTETLMDLMLESGAPGLNLNYGRLVAAECESTMAGARVNDEYALLRCITGQGVGTRICDAVEQRAQSLGVQDICVVVNSVPQVATYVPGEREFRRDQKTPPEAGKPLASFR